MTIGQITVFSEAVTKWDNIDMSRAITAALAGARYEQKSLNELYKELGK